MFQVCDKFWNGPPIVDRDNFSLYVIMKWNNKQDVACPK
jgi:hypothetical protein